MHLHFEKNNNAKCDCNILSLSWMGKVPDESPEMAEENRLQEVRKEGRKEGRMDDTFYGLICI
ncbi:Tubby-related protein 4, partial [Vespula maculifrons]